MQGKLSQSELRARMSAIRADINRRISAADIGLSAAPTDIAERRAKVMQCTPEAFRFFCKTYLPHYFPDDSESVAALNQRVFYDVLSNRILGQAPDTTVLELSV